MKTRYLGLLVSSLAFAIVACDPQDGGLGPTSLPNTNGNGGGGGGGAGDNYVPRIDGVFHFAVSADPGSPNATTAMVEPGPLDLYLWLVASNMGLSALECDLFGDGVEFPETDYFTPAADVLFLTWEGSGDVDLAIGGCPDSARLLGTIHAVAGTDSVTVAIGPGSQHAGAVDCHPIDPWLNPFSCQEFVGVPADPPAGE